MFLTSSFACFYYFKYVCFTDTMYLWDWDIPLALKDKYSENARYSGREI